VRRPIAVALMLGAVCSGALQFGDGSPDGRGQGPPVQADGRARSDRRRNGAEGQLSPERRSPFKDDDPDVQTDLEVLAEGPKNAGG